MRILSFLFFTFFLSSCAKETLQFPQVFRYSQHTTKQTPFGCFNANSSSPVAIDSTSKFYNLQKEAVALIPDVEEIMEISEIELTDQSNAILTNKLPNSVYFGSKINATYTESGSTLALKDSTNTFTLNAYRKGNDLTTDVICYRFAKKVGNNITYSLPEFISLAPSSTNEIISEIKNLNGLASTDTIAIVFFDRFYKKQ